MPTSSSRHFLHLARRSSREMSTPITEPPVEFALITDPKLRTISRRALHAAFMYLQKHNDKNRVKNRVCKNLGFLSKNLAGRFLRFLNNAYKNIGNEITALK